MGQRFSTPVCLKSPLRLHEVFQRVSASAGGVGGLWSDGESPFHGDVGGDSCRLIATGGGRDLQKRELRLNFMNDVDGGTRIEGGFVLRSGTLIFAVLWFGFVSVFLIAGLIARVRSDRSDDAAFFLLVPTLMLTFGVLFAVVLGFVGRWYEKSMIRYLKVLLDAK